MSAWKTALRLIATSGVAFLVAVVAAGGAAHASRRPGKKTLPQLRFDLSVAKSHPLTFDPTGPYYHDVFVASSRDGLHFSAGRLILRRASVPDAVRLPSGRIFVYAVDGAGRSIHGLVVAASDDNGKHWTVGSVQMPGVRPGGFADPDVVLLPDGAIRMYVMSMPAPGSQSNAPNKLLSFVSRDGVSFRQEPGVRFEYAAGTDPDVVKIGASWFLYLSHGPEEIVARSSNDAKTFTYVGVERTDGMVSDTVAIGGGRYRQYYCSSSESGIVSAVTRNGLTFTDEPGVRITAPAHKGVCDPSALPAWNGQTLLFYKTTPLPTAGQDGSPRPGGNCNPAPGAGPGTPGGQQPSPPPPGTSSTPPTTTSDGQPPAPGACPPPPPGGGSPGPPNP